MLRGARGYSVVDYAATFTGALMVMIACQGPLKRAIQARLRQGVDHVFAIEPGDVTGPPGKQGEKTQKAGIEVHDPGSGFGGGDVIAKQTVSQRSDYTERRTSGGGSVTIARNGVLSRNEEQGSSILSDTNYVPPDFLRRPRGLDAIWKTPKGITRPKTPDVDQPIGPPGPGVTGPPAPGETGQRSN